MENQLNYDLMLFNLIPLLKSYPSKSGGEGVAYFIGDKYVVKHYTCEFCNLNKDIFDLYCKEINQFKKKGYNVAEIYSWLAVPEKNDKMQYYMLEEQIKGRTFYRPSIIHAYEMFTDLCDEKEFSDVILRPETDKALFKEVLKRYVSDFVMFNEMLLDMDEKQIEKFIFEMYAMMYDGKYSMPDVYTSNVLTNNNGFTFIDSSIVTEERQYCKNEIYPIDYVISRVIQMLSYNQIMNSFAKGSIYGMGRECKKEIKQNLSANKKYTKLAASKMVDLINKVFDNPVLISKEDYQDVKFTIHGILDSKKEAEELLSKFNVSFER